VARFEEVADPELTDRVELLAYRDHGLKVVKTTVTGFGWVDLAPRYAFAGFELADAPGPGFSGSPVLDERGRVLGISTQTRRDGDTERGMAMQLGQVMPLAQRNHKPERGHGMSANSGEEIYNRCIVEGTGRDGQPLQVERYAGQQPGAVAFSEVVPSPSFSNPSFDTNTTGWSGVTRDTVTSTPGRSLAVSRLTGLGLRRSREPSSAV
jgi:hypothetical protein